MGYDISVENHGTNHLVIPENSETQDWLEEHTDGHWFGQGLQ